ncbi:MAG: MiaB/RimO family radical SAM methylthiotransferase [Phycisphaeraceae bacterium]|nr:MiaB/RimO family radical SAM methylthiotransferase [Phycisphaeraceae bacterium]
MTSKRVYIETFGCQMNELDSELVSGQLRALGYRFTPDPASAEVVLYNTCSVRELAEQKVWSRLGEMTLRKKKDPSLVVGVLGCLAERDGEALIRRMPVVDVLVGPAELDKLPSLLDNAVRTNKSLAANPAIDANTPGENRVVSARQIALQGSSSRRSGTLAAAEDSLEMLDLSRSVSPIDSGASNSRSAYVRITRGCNKFCTYCVVPFTRGAEIHRPPEHILDECKRLADAGVIEITLLGQTVNHYRFEHGAAVTVNGMVQPQKGRSFTGGHRRDPFAGDSTTTFADLLAEIHEKIPAIKRLRFVTSYPRDFGDDVLEVMRDHPRICRYLHAPAQSGSDRILKLMNRGYTVSEYLEFVDRARSFLHEPEKGRPLGLSGDFIVGFPTETQDDFFATMRLLERARYKNSFIFKYSPRPGTVAIDKLTDDVAESEKRRRNSELLALQNRVGEEVARESVGQVLEVFVEGPSQREEKRRRRAEMPRNLVSLTVGGRGNEDSSLCDSSNGITPGGPGEDEHKRDEAAAKVAAQYGGRTDTDLIVLFDLPAQSGDPSGHFLNVRIDSVRGLSLFGTVV